MTKLCQFSHRKPCYYCGASPPSTAEHAPPQVMFAGFECDSITVPACDKHNTQKSIGDMAVVSAILMSVDQQSTRGATDATPNVLKAMSRLKPNFDRAKNEVALRPFLKGPSREFDTLFPYVQPLVDLPSWIRQLTAALAWSVIGSHDSSIQWEETGAWSPTFFSTSLTPEEAVRTSGDNKAVELELNALCWRHGWSAHTRKYPEDIYTFDVSFLENPEEWNGREVVFRHRFYNGASVWYAGFTPSPGNKSRLADACG
jgi:hypothetical protein